MKNIVILRCLHSNDVCTGAGCLQAFNTYSGAFRCYGGEELRLVAFFACSGCGDVTFNNQKGLEEKLNRIVALKPDAVHIGVCTRIRDKVVGIKHECGPITEIAGYLADKGIQVVRGTHA